MFRALLTPSGARRRRLHGLHGPPSPSRLARTVVAPPGVSSSAIDWSEFKVPWETRGGPRVRPGVRPGVLDAWMG